MSYALYVLVICLCNVASTSLQSYQILGDQKEMKEEILSLLGMTHRPRQLKADMKHNSAPQYMLQLYQILKDEENLESGSFLNYADTVMGFVNQAKNEYPLDHERDKILQFDLSDLTLGVNVLGAQLRIFKNITEELDEQANITIIIYKIATNAQG